MPHHLKHTASHSITLHHTASHSITLHHTATHCNTLHHATSHSNSLHHTASHCITLHHTATHCNTLQHTATHYRSVRWRRGRVTTRLFAARTRLSLDCHLRCVTWLIHTCATWHIETCDMTHSYMWHDAFICDQAICGTNEAEPRLSSDVCDMNRSYMRGMAHSYVWHDSSIYVT